MPRSFTSRLAWLSQTLIAIASGRINQNVNYKHTCLFLYPGFHIQAELSEISGHSMNVRIANTNVRTNTGQAGCVGPPLKESWNYLIRSDSI